MQWRDLVAVLLCVGIVGMVVKSLLGQWRRGDSVPLRGRLSAAKDWLDDNGYHIVRVREHGEWIGYYGDRAYKKVLIADFVVRQGTKYYAVKLANSRDSTVTGLKLRDQWYPLFVAFGVDGVLHLDLDSEQVHIVDFDVRSPRYVRWRKVVNRGLWFLSGVLLAFAWLHRR